MTIYIYIYIYTHIHIYKKKNTYIYIYIYNKEAPSSKCNYDSSNVIIFIIIDSRKPGNSNSRACFVNYTAPASGRGPLVTPGLTQNGDTFSNLC